MFHSDGLLCKSMLIFLTQQRRIRLFTCTHIYSMNIHIQPYPYKHLQKTEPADPRDWWNHHTRLAVDGHIAYHWKINIWTIQKKCEHMCLVNDMNSDEQVLPWATLPAKLRSVRGTGVHCALHDSWHGGWAPRSTLLLLGHRRHTPLPCVSGFNLTFIM